MEDLYAYTLAVALGWFVGFACGTVRKHITKRRADRDAIRNNLTRSNAPAVALARYRDGHARRTALRDVGPSPIPWDHYGIGFGGSPPVGPARGTDAAALT